MSRSKWLMRTGCAAVLLLSLFLLGQWVLGCFGLAFRNVVIWTTFFLFSLLAVTFLIQTICLFFSWVFKKGKSFFLRISAGILSAVLSLSLLILFFYSPLVVFAYQPEHVVEISNQKMIVRVNSFLHIWMEYYDYQNFFVRKNTLRLWVDAGNGGHDPYQESHDPLVYRYAYYDHEGNLQLKGEENPPKALSELEKNFH